MEFSLFAHMERIDEGQSQKRLYDEFVELCQIADRSGFKTIWNGEHHGMNSVSYTHLTLPTKRIV